jgi:Uma2 family endonuclease
VQEVGVGFYGRLHSDMETSMAEAAGEFPRCTATEYLEFENDGSIKHEFVNGVVFAMSGASRRHNLIAGDLHTALNVHLPITKCQAYTLDTKVHVKAADDERYFYPDVFVTCSELDTDAYASRFPVLVIEVTSPSTEEFDRGAKFEAYRLLTSLQEYALVAQDTRLVELFRKRTNWAVEHYRNDEAVTFESVDLTIPVSTLYRRVAL